MSIFELELMRKAFLVGGLLGIIIPLIGVTIVLKRLSMIGDALSHTSLAGVAAGLIMGVNPIVGATVSCIIAAFGIEGIRKKFPQNSELAIAIIMAAGIGLTGVLSGYVKSAANFNSFLFGSITTIDTFDLWMVVILSVGVALVSLILYRALCFVAYDETAAHLAGVSVEKVNFIFVLLTAITVSVASRTVGALMVSSLMVIPVACSLLISKSYFQTVIISALFGVFFTIAGLFLSFYVGIALPPGPKPGGTIVLTAVISLLCVFAYTAIRKRVKRKHVTN